MTDYSSPVSEILKLGEPEIAGPEDWPDYAQEIGLNAEHIPELIRMALDESLDELDIDVPESWGRVHAWRALGQLKAEAAIEPLMALFSGLSDSEWMWEELPDVYAMIGPAAIPALSTYLADSSQDEHTREIASECLLRIAQFHPNHEAECVGIFTRQLELFAESGESLNAYLISNLVELKAVDAAPVIEQAHMANRVDKSLLGDWEDVQIYLGLKTERETPRQTLSMFTNQVGSPASDKLHPGKNKEDKKAKTRRKQADKSRKQNRKKKRK